MILNKVKLLFCKKNNVPPSFFQTLAYKIRWKFFELSSRRRLNHHKKTGKTEHYFIYQGKTYNLSLFSNADLISHRIVCFNSFFEYDYLEIMADYILPNDTVIDIGANIGNHAVYFSDVLGADVHAFEGNSNLFPVLEKNIKNRTITLHKVFLGEKIGFCRPIINEKKLWKYIHCGIQLRDSRDRFRFTFFLIFSCRFYQN